MGKEISISGYNGEAGIMTNTLKTTKNVNENKNCLMTLMNNQSSKN